MDLVKGQKLLVLRYNIKAEPKCIELHQKVIDQKGYCWFGKIGKIPSPWMLEAVFADGNPSIILFNRSGAFLAGVSDFSYETQYEGTPEYYSSQLYKNGMYPESYFKLKSIQIIDFNELNDFYVVSSCKRLMDTLNGRAMSSFFFVSYKELPSSLTRNTVSDRFDQKKQQGNVCRYAKNGMCTNRKSVNFRYDCENPNACIRQSF